VVTVVTGKRSGDTTGDPSSMTDSNPDQKDDQKRLGNISTPKQLIIRLRQLGYTVQQTTHSGTVKFDLTKCNVTATINPSQHHSPIVMMQNKAHRTLHIRDQTSNPQTIVC
jgi:hypothetical protein